MRKSDNPTSRDYDDYIASALAPKAVISRSAAAASLYTMRMALASAGTTASR